MLAFEEAVLDARREIGSGPPVVRVRNGAAIPYYGTEQIRTLEIDGEWVDFHLLKRNLGLWVVTAAFDTEGNLIVVLQLKYGVGEVSIQLSPGGAGKFGGEPSEEEIIERAGHVFAQETGYRGGSWTSLGHINIDDNKVTGPSGTGPLKAHLLMADGLVQVQEPKPKVTEFYRVITIPPADFPALLASPYLTEASAVACLHRAFLSRGLLKWG